MRTRKKPRPKCQIPKIGKIFPQQPLSFSRRKNIQLEVRTYNVVEALSPDSLVHLLVSVELVGHGSEETGPVLSHLLDHVPEQLVNIISVYYIMILGELGSF